MLVAPHGGRRPRSSAVDEERPRKVNDLHTADLTLELAARLSATAIINRAEDRNRLDLNRVSHVRTGAPWLLDVLLEWTRLQLATAEQATILFVHGWNAIQPSCDVGIGAHLAAGAFVPVKQGVPTIPPSFLPRLGRFAESCRRSGIEVTVGHRYPAAGRENMLQIFTARYADDADSRIRELAAFGAAGRIAAVQLELAVPLRWPGVLRDGFLAAAGELAGTEKVDDAGCLGGLQAASARTTPDRIALEFHDGVAGVGGFVATERLASNRRFGRLLFAIGAKRLVLFTGEDGRPDPDTLRCMGLEWDRDDSASVTLRFAGPCLTFPRTDPFLDLEAGLADATLSNLAARLVWRPATSGPGVALGAQVGHLEGPLRLDGGEMQISAPAVLHSGAEEGGGSWRERRVLRIPLGAGTFLFITSRLDQEESVDGQITYRGQPESLLSGRVSVHKSQGGLIPEAWRIEAVSRSARLRVFGQVTHAIPVIRPAADHKVLTVFGLARFSWEDRVGFGTFEHSQRLERKRGVEQ